MDIDIDSLRGALIQFVPLAVTGKERKISTLLKQGVELSTSARTYYIQRDISETMEGVGRSRDLESHQVITLADYLLLKYLIETLIQQYEEEGAVWFRETTWYYACIFGFWLQHAAEANIGGKYYELFMSGFRPSPHGEES